MWSSLAMWGERAVSNESLVPDFPEGGGWVEDDGTVLRYLPSSRELSALQALTAKRQAWKCFEIGVARK